MAAHHVAGVSREFIGEMAESSRLLERARELHDPAEHSIYVQMFGQDCGITARAMSSRPLWALGFPDRALVRAEETVAIARSVRDPLMVTFSLVIAQSMRLYRGDAAQALSIGDEILALCREYRLPQEAEWSRSLQGAALIALGRTDEGIERLVDSLAVQRALNAYLVRPHFLAQLAGGYRHAGQIERGLAAVDEGLASAAQTNQHGYIADLHRERGELLWLGGDTAAAEQSLREAIAACAPQQLKSFELRAATALARLLRDTARAADARSVLEPVYGWFTEGFDTADLVAARTLLSQIG
jgi:tetratricopeptide (TPR) repeat protein